MIKFSICKALREKHIFGVIIARHVWKENREWVHQNRLTPECKLLYKARKETIERSFADSKELQGFAIVGLGVEIMFRSKRF